ncbi:MAG: hypothetical protein GXP08_01465 [Gammaproteobacteria bacterium]|nr:hypothetical protein [Gammaproteobacteria bacterium]
MNINLHIERLVLDGVLVEPQQRAELKAVVESELRQQLVSQGISSTMQSNNNHQSVRAGSISIENIHKPVSLGQQIGNAVYRGIRK